MMSPRLAGLRVAVDVQHAYRSGVHALDRGSVYRLADGTKRLESDLAAEYARALCAAMAAGGATVWTSDPTMDLLVGPYSRRQKQATALGANLYLACHVNAGHGSYPVVEMMEGTPGRTMATVIVRELGELPGLINRRVQRLSRLDRGAVCVRGFTAGPSLLLEPFFGDNPTHEWLMDHVGLQAVGQAIARGVAMAWIPPA